MTPENIFDPPPDCVQELASSFIFVTLSTSYPLGANIIHGSPPNAIAAGGNTAAAEDDATHKKRMLRARPCAGRVDGRCLRGDA